MQREKLYSLHRTVRFPLLLLILNKVSDSVRLVFHNDERLVAQSYFCCQKQKVKQLK